MPTMTGYLMTKSWSPLVTLPRLSRAQGRQLDELKRRWQRGELSWERATALARKVRER